MFDIEKWHNNTINDLHRLAKMVLDIIEDDVDKQIEVGFMTQEIEKAIDEAKLYKLYKLKCSQGGKKSAQILTKEERRERASKAGKAKIPIVKNINKIN